MPSTVPFFFSHPSGDPGQKSSSSIHFLHLQNADLVLTSPLRFSQHLGLAGFLRPNPVRLGRRPPLFPSSVPIVEFDWFTPVLPVHPVVDLPLTAIVGVVAVAAAWTLFSPTTLPVVVSDTSCCCAAAGVCRLSAETLLFFLMPSLGTLPLERSPSSTNRFSDISYSPPRSASAKLKNSQHFPVCFSFLLIFSFSPFLTANSPCVSSFLHR